MKIANKPSLLIYLKNNNFFYIYFKKLKTLFITKYVYKTYLYLHIKTVLQKLCFKLIF